MRLLGTVSLEDPLLPQPATATLNERLMLVSTVFGLKDTASVTFYLYYHQHIPKETKKQYIYLTSIVCVTTV